MRTLVLDGTTTVHVHNRRATVRVHGAFVARLVKVTGGRWAGPDGKFYRGPADAAAELSYPA
jgi:hypothetical protein